ncbi:tRNA lysidine(34) synthetase TilS [bacterium]|nr:tRNA lysidine(34) synthetase TilS [bacterium]
MMAQLRTHSDFLSRLESDLRAREIGGGRILVAVSGGADSVALLRGLHALTDTLRLNCVVAHVNHCLRDADSDRDAEWVTELAERLGIECHIRSADLSAAARNGQSLEEAARSARYSLLTELAVETHCAAVAVAHTADDQTETILHHLIRGTGLAGLAGMPHARPLQSAIELIRPLLSIRREQIEQWLSEIGQDFRIDASNLDRGFTRNRIRHDLLPLLEEQFNPAFRQVLASLSEQAVEAAAFVRRRAEELADRALQSATSETLRIDCSLLQPGEPVLIRETLRTIWSRAGWPLKRMGFREWQRLSELVVDGPAVNLAGQIDARRRGTLLILTRPIPVTVHPTAPPNSFDGKKPQ